MLTVLIAGFVVVPDIVDVVETAVVCRCCWSQCLSTGWGFGVGVAVGRLEAYSVYSHQRNDKDQLKGTQRPTDTDI